MVRPATSPGVAVPGDGRSFLVEIRDIRVISRSTGRLRLRRARRTGRALPPPVISSTMA